MPGAFCLLALAPILTTAVSAQPPAEFEVATIKAIDPSIPGTMSIEVHPGGRVVISSFSLKGLVSIAFNVGYWQLSGGDDWTEKTNYLLEAKPPDNIRPAFSTRHSLFTIGDERLREMLQALLIDRFQLRFHRDTKTGTVHLLKLNPNATLRLRPSEDSPTASGEPAGSMGWAEQWALFHTTMPQLAKFAADFYLHAPVRDETGLTGAFDYRSPPEDVESHRSNPTGSFLNMIREIGLKLESAKGPVETFVIDHAAKPSPN
jgi:uncharacterized protein (TIGR03435 family)